LPPGDGSINSGSGFRSFNDLKKFKQKGQYFII
jgi:hypothetical protein